MDGFLALTDGIIYAIKIADSKDLPRVEEVSIHACIRLSEPMSCIFILIQAQKLLHRLATRDLFHEKHLEEKVICTEIYIINMQLIIIIIQEANAEYEIEVLQRAVHEKWRGAVFVQVAT